MTTKMKLVLAVCVSGIAPPVMAQMAAPAYYAEALFAVTAAEQIAAFCPTVELDLDHATQTADALLARLADDGVTGDTVTKLTGLEEQVGALQVAFMERHGLEGAGQSAVCAAASTEMAQGSPVGLYLMETRP